MNPIPPDKVPAELAALRRRKGWSIAETAAAMGIEGEHASDTIRKIERGAKPASGTFRLLLAHLIAEH